MKQHSKLLLSSLALAAGVALSAGAAQARTDLSIGIGVPAEPVYAAPQPVYPAPVYYAPAPAYVEPGFAYYNYNGRDTHRHYDWNYWHQTHPGARWHR